MITLREGERGRREEERGRERGEAGREGEKGNNNDYNGWNLFTVCNQVCVYIFSVCVCVCVCLYVIFLTRVDDNHLLLHRHNYIDFI